MNLNFSSILSNGLRILNIANRALPLIKEINPTFQMVKNSLTKYKENNIQKMMPQQIIMEPERKKIVYQDNSLTFFR